MLVYHLGSRGGGARTEGVHYGVGVAKFNEIRRLPFCCLISFASPYRRPSFVVLIQSHLVLLTLLVRFCIFVLAHFAQKLVAGLEVDLEFVTD